jgi:hypothetical protein
MISSLKGPVAAAARERHQAVCPDGMYVRDDERQQRLLTPWFSQMVRAGVVDHESAANATERVKRKRGNGKQPEITVFFSKNGRKKRTQVIPMTDNDIKVCMAVERALTSLGIRINPLARQNGTLKQFCHFTKQDLPNIKSLNVSEVDLTSFPLQIMVHLTGMKCLTMATEQLFDIPKQWAHIEIELTNAADLFDEVVLSQ